MIQCPNPIGCPDADDGLASVVNSGYAMEADNRPFEIAAGYSGGGQQVVCDASTVEAAQDCVITTISENVEGSSVPPITIFANTAQTFSLECNGETVSYTTPSGYFYAKTQEAANHAAYGFAIRIVNILCAGGEFELFQSSEQTCSIPCSGGGTVSYTVPAGTFTSDSQQSADDAAYAFACELAALLCIPPLPDPNGTPTGGSGGLPTTPPILFSNAEQTCTVSCEGGGSYRVAVSAGTVYASNPATANAQANSLACARANSGKLCLGSIETIMCEGSAYVAQIELSGGVSPFTTGMTVVSGNLPPGLSLGFSGLISGTPTVTGSYTFTVEQADAQGTASRTYTLTVVEIVTDSLPGATEGDAYSETIQQAGATVYTFGVSAGSLPPGLSLNESTGVISGTPTADGTYDFDITMTAIS